MVPIPTDVPELYNVLLAAQVPVAALVLDSSFASALDVAQGAYPWLPVRWLMRHPFRADLAAPALTMPVLQVHCRDDPVDIAMTPALVDDDCVIKSVWIDARLQAELRNFVNSAAQTVDTQILSNQ